MNNLSYDLELLNNEISSCLLADDFVIQQTFETEDIPFLFVKIRDKFGKKYIFLYKITDEDEDLPNSFIEYTDELWKKICNNIEIEEVIKRIYTHGLQILTPDTRVTFFIKITAMSIALEQYFLIKNRPEILDEEKDFILSIKNGMKADDLKLVSRNDQYAIFSNIITNGVYLYFIDLDSFVVYQSESEFPYSVLEEGDMEELILNSLLLKVDILHSKYDKDHKMYLASMRFLEIVHRIIF